MEASHRSGSPVMEACLRMYRNMSTSSPNQTGQPPRPSDFSSADDPTMVRDRAGRLGVPRRPPGHNPGETMHQKGNLERPHWLSIPREIRPIIPLFVMVAGAFTLAAWCMHRQVIRNPAVAMSKDRRKRLYELEDPESGTEHGVQYQEKNWLRDFVFSEHPFMKAWRQAFYGEHALVGAKTPISDEPDRPARLPGDKGPKNQEGRPLFGGANQ